MRIKKKLLSLALFATAAMFLILLAPMAQACTYTPGYWKNHPERMVYPENRLPITIGALILDTPEEVVAILNIEPRGDATYILAHYLIAAKLTVADWAIIDSNTQAMMDNSDALLAIYPLGSNPKGDAREAMIGLAEQISAFLENPLEVHE